MVIFDSSILIDQVRTSIRVDFELIRKYRDLKPEVW